MNIRKFLNEMADTGRAQKSGTRIRAALKAAGFTVKLSRRNGIRAKVEVMCSAIIADQVVVISGEGANDEEAWLAAEAEARARGLL